MSRLLDWLARHRRLTIATTIVGCVAMILCHDIVNEAVGNFREHCSSSTYFNHVITLIGIGLLAGLSLGVMAMGIRAEDRILKLAYGAMTLGLGVLCYCTLFVLNSEAAHFIQYALVSLPLYALFTRSKKIAFPMLETILIGTLIGMIDECYQFFVLYAHRLTHLDFNDFVTNMVSVSLGVVLIWIFDGASRRVTDPQSGGRRPGDSPIGTQVFRRCPMLVLSAFLLFAAIAAWKSGLICHFPDQKRFAHSVVLRRSRPVHTETFWLGTDWGKTWHLLSPVEALAVMLLLTALYAPLDPLASRRWGKSPAAAATPISPDPVEPLLAQTAVHR